jgi:chemotaxis protein CheD
MSNLHVDILNRFKERKMQDVGLLKSPVSVMTAVNFCELKISQNPVETLVAFSIGSGMGVSIYDPVTQAGGLLNFVLPDSSMLLPVKSERNPFMFADTGLASFLSTLHDIGAKTESLKVVIAGGSKILDQTSEFDIGLKNQQAANSFIARNNLVIHYEDMGGISKRILSLDIGSGCNVIKTLGQGEVNV